MNDTDAIEKGTEDLGKPKESVFDGGFTGAGLKELLAVFKAVTDEPKFYHNKDGLKAVSVDPSHCMGVSVTAVPVDYHSTGGVFVLPTDDLEKVTKAVKKGDMVTIGTAVEGELRYEYGGVRGQG